jgi:eukaryotic-like serine/threonine-protein kinase
VGSTEIAAELGDRRFRRLIARWLGIIRAVLRRHGGREVDVAGDGLFAVFDTPAAALRAAFEATSAVHELGIEMRSGVHLGEVELDTDGTVRGIAVHLGSRIAAQAVGGEVLTDARTGELVSGAGFHFDDRGSHELKGIEGPQSLLAAVEMDDEPLEPVLDDEEARARRRAASSGDTGAYRSHDAAARVDMRPFVGRTQEFGELRSALGDAFSGRGSLLLVSGEPGIGKSRLMEELAQHASISGWGVLQGRCWEGGGAPAYWPWVQVIRAAGGEFEEFAPAEAEAVGAAVPDAVEPEAARFRLFDRVSRYLADAAREHPSLVVLDDLHAADEPSLLLLRFLATTARERPLMFMGSYREGDPRLHEVAEPFAELARLGRRIRLRGLTVDDIASYIELVAGEAPHSDVVARISDVTGGNPFFIGEVVRTLAAEGRLRDADRAALLRLPEEVRALIRRRLAGLSREAVDSLRVGSVVGREFDLRIVSAATTLSSERLVDVVAEAVDAGVLSEDVEVHGTYRFTHDLVRETLYEDLPAARRLELHRTVGTALQEAAAEDIEPHLAELAYHFAQAAPLGDGERAVDYSVRAGDRASAILAYEDAARQYARALQLLAPGDPVWERRCEILLRLGDVRSRTTDEEGARQSFEEAAAIAKRRNAGEQLARAALGYSTIVEPIRLGLGGLMITSLFEVGTKGVTLLEEALGALPEQDSPLRARLLARQAMELYTSGQHERRLALSQAAVEMALRIGDPDALVTALLGRHWATLAPDSVMERLANSQEMLVSAMDAGDEEATFLARQSRLHCFLELCDMAGFDAELDAMTQLAGRIRQPFYVWHTACLRAIRALVDGRLGDAERGVRGALEGAKLRESEYVMYTFEYAQIVGIRWAQGRLGEVRDRIEEHGERYRAIARWRDALVAAEVGDERAARAEIERHARDGFAGLPRDGLWILHVSALAQACVLLRDHERAATLYELLAPYADRNAISVSTIPFGPVAMRLGMLATLLERWDDAQRQFEVALDQCDRMGARPIRAMTAIEFARMLRARGTVGDEDRGDDLLRDATGICEELEMHSILERATRLTRATGGAPGVVGREAAFRREGQYWTISYAGEMTRLHDLKGIRYIAALLAVPGREVHVLELATAGAGGAVGARAEGLPASRGEAAAPVLDPQAKEAYRSRLSELAEDLEEARTWNDPERAAKIEREIDVLTRELAGALGLGGRDRSLPSVAERARISVTKAIKAALRAIAKESPALGEHLSASIRTGRFCSYAPPGREPPTWAL